MNIGALLLAALAWTVALGVFTGAGAMVYAIVAQLREEQDFGGTTAFVLLAAVVFIGLFLALLGGALL